MDIEHSVERFIIDEIMLGDRQSRLEPDKSLLDSGILDSLALLRLIAFLEERFGITVDDGEVIPDNFQSLSLIKAFLEEKMAR